MVRQYARGEPHPLPFSTNGLFQDQYEHTHFSTALYIKMREGMHKCYSEDISQPCILRYDKTLLELMLPVV